MTTEYAYWALVSAENHDIFAEHETDRLAGSSWSLPVNPRARACRGPSAGVVIGGLFSCPAEGQDGKQGGTEKERGRNDRRTD